VSAISRIVKSSVTGACVTLALAAFLAARASADFPYQFGIDFYQFWGVPVAKEASATQQSPYADPSGYARALNAISDASSSEKLHHANSYRRTLEPMGTPFLYASFAIFPVDYDQAQALFAVLQYLAAGASVYVLARLRGIAKWPAVWIALIVELTFNPFLQDVKFGNVNSLQLAFMAALLLAATRRPRSGNALLDGLVIGLLAVFVIFKPNTPWIALAFAIHYWVTLGHRKFAIATGVAAVLAALAFGIGAWYFADARVWPEWLRFARAMDGSGLALTLDQGNLSLSMLLAQRSMSYGPVGYGLIIATALSVALIVAASSGGHGARRAWTRMRDAFSNPWFAASIGIVFTFATSPLVWPHYHVFALIPILWLVRFDGEADVGTWGAVICYGALSVPFIGFLIAGGYYGAVQTAMLLSWIALVPGVFAHVVEQHRIPQAAA
jgi:Glycosyltransferase family 87